jgi:CRP-like cAMP-binding protein
METNKASCSGNLSKGVFINMEKYIGLLRLTGFFDDFSNEELLKLFTENPCDKKTYAKGSFIHFEGEKCSFWDIILGGNITIQKIDEKGNILTLSEFRAGNNIGGNMLFSKYPFFPMSVFAKSKVTVLHIKREFVLNLCQINKNFLIQFLASNSDKALVLSDKIKAISMKSIRESIIDFINYEYYAQESMKIQLPASKRELAERFGIQRTSLSRELKKMKDDGLIDYNNKSITILNVQVIRLDKRFHIKQ